MAAGHGNGTVTLWSPNMGNPLVSLLAHRGAVRAMAVDATGHHLVTAGADAQVKVWDVRTFKPLHSYFSASPASALDISQRGLLAVSYGPHVQARRAA
jgi:U3 small nucleolar RNA-associated protein 7